MTTTTTNKNTTTHTAPTLTPSQLRPLALAAISAKKRAYCPYSNFRVGASILVSTGTIHAGSNVEVASTPVGICAERCALAPLVASIERPALPQVTALAVATDIWPPSSPCGMCRQMIREFCELDTPIYMYGRRPLDNGGAKYPEDLAPEDELRVCGEPLVMTIGELLPLSFGPNDMAKRERVDTGRIG